MRKAFFIGVFRNLMYNYAITEVELKKFEEQGERALNKSTENPQLFPP